MLPVYPLVWYIIVSPDRWGALSEVQFSTVPLEFIRHPKLKLVHLKTLVLH